MFVCGYFGDHDLLRARTEAEKYMLLATLKLEECVVFRIGARILTIVGIPPGLKRIA